MALLIRGGQPTTVFRLNGADENSASNALAWVLEQSPYFLRLFIQEAFGERLDVDEAVITVQKHGLDKGFTDIEIQVAHEFHAILEAKRWWDVPKVKQLNRYRSRLASTGAERQRLISVSAADSLYAQRHLPKEIGGVEIVHLSWAIIQRLATTARAKASSFEEKLWLRQLIQHLQEFVAMDRLSDNKVFVVALGIETMVKGRKHTWIDVVEKDQSYFHPIGKGWPVQPPNHVAFRYHGKLQSVHHVDGFEIVRDLASCNASWPKTNLDHFVYRLGPPMRPATEVRTGKIFMNGRVWCAIDTLLSGAFRTISAARDETRRRLSEAL